MKRLVHSIAIAFVLVLGLFLVSRAQFAPPPGHPADPNAKPGNAAVFTDFTGEVPGKVHHITAADLPDPWNTKSSAVFSRPVPRGDMWPKAPEGFKVDLYAESLKGEDGKALAPRTIITAPNGDFFVAAQNQGQVLVFRTGPDGKMAQMSVFASKLNLPFGREARPSPAVEQPRLLHEFHSGHSPLEPGPFPHG